MKGFLLGLILGAATLAGAQTYTTIAGTDHAKALDYAETKYGQNAFVRITYFADQRYTKREMGFKTVIGLKVTACDNTGSWTKTKDRLEQGGICDGVKVLGGN